jgi:hypothetical protein
MKWLEFGKWIENLNEIVCELFLRAPSTARDWRSSLNEK